MPSKRYLSLLCIIATLLAGSSAFGWHDETHLAVAKAARFQKWYNAVAPDIAKEKAGYREQYNHYCDLPLEKTVTPDMVLAQASLYNDPKDAMGHLYGAIIGAVREYRKARQTDPGKYSEYHLAYVAHYLADLSQPLHNVVYDEFNIKWHKYCDGIIEAEALENVDEIRKRMYDVVIDPADLETDLAREVARVANESRRLARVLTKEQRPLTREEAYRQLGHSASVLKALLYSLSFQAVAR
ncbi:hypothetical protein LPW11_09560 [Geomonas sp. RF6]|uniref:hypothetical protein n=1 Tax=Geomonas sp. RF6 TaxID=2897342 RepID=UPI001E3D704E|nr:hypothetical protein [Geomonas sp. RF6]UFS72423.1 hypothetical protein LPW11_09560 [Geomonas sp. RF6]